MNWLFKEEPTHYSYDDLVRDGKTSWTGVRNPLAQKHLRSVKKGDEIFFYHTGDEKAVVGIMRAAANAYADPADKTGKLSAVDVEPVRKLDDARDAGGDQGGQALRVVSAHAAAAPVGDAGHRRANGTDRRDVEGR